MRLGTRLTMSMRELDRLKMIQAVWTRIRPQPNGATSLTLSGPGILILWQVASRIMRGQFIGILEQLRVDHQVATARVPRRREQNPFRTVFDRDVREKPTRWLDSLVQSLSAPLTIPVRPQLVPFAAGVALLEVNNG
jgi:hypothetical protein